MKTIDDEWFYRGVRIYSTWHTKRPTGKFNQVYVVCFRKDGKVLIMPQTSSDGMSIPGGHPEKGESIRQTAIRECMEEVTIRVSHIKLLGYARTIIPKNNAGLTPGISIQARCAALIDEVLPQKIDPDKGVMRPRKFISPYSLNAFLKWGKVGDEIRRRAIRYYGTIKK